MALCVSLRSSRLLCIPVYRKMISLKVNSRGLQSTFLPKLLSNVSGTVNKFKNPKDKRETV